VNQVHAISGRLSLRAPQRRSLEILANVVDLIPLTKNRDLATAQAKIHEAYPSVTDFERDFPSLCFALATGVGKTRLMGAFISYLHLAKGIRHFFVLAPNLTIYNKLIADFTPNMPKYVFHGIAEFATHPPEIITGDNYENGRGVRKEAALPGFERDVHINIFNISKINSEVRGGNAPRIKRLSEYIGESYFSYLSGLKDLVLLMDESHRYRASAGVKAINELNPVLGLELTATPQIESGKVPQHFKNVIYSYPLSDALKDGFVKEPAVATRENFNAANYTEAQLERLKLEDGIRIHEDTRAELEAYAHQSERPIVKPFMLVVAQDTKHAEELLAMIRSDDFFGGRYKNSVITVHSNQRGDEADETVQRLLAVEDPQEPTEIVIHVNMLKEGWDVTNLYTIVPLRAANSRTLVEQSIGRGLRLPYGKRVGVKAVDRLTIVAHDHFEEIINEANNPDSIIRAGVVIGRDIPLTPRQTVEIQPVILQRVIGPVARTDGQVPGLFDNPGERAIAMATLSAIEDFRGLPSSSELQSTKVLADLVRDVSERMAQGQAALPGLGEKADIPKTVAKTVKEYTERIIDIPRIVVQPKGEVTGQYAEFNLDLKSIPRFEPVSQEILIEHLRTHERERLMGDDPFVREDRLEDYLVNRLVDFDDIDYEVHSDLLYKLASTVVKNLQSYLKDEADMVNVLQYHRDRLGQWIHDQMQNHYVENPVEYDIKVSQGFTSLRSSMVTSEDRAARDFRQVVENRQSIREIVFTGFRRCLYDKMKFQSDPERRFAVILETDSIVLKWVKPPTNTFRIYYRGDAEYEPDFVVETDKEKLICEVKDRTEMTDESVQAKAKAAVLWCERASRHAKKYDTKPWRYLLIPDNAITASATIGALASAYTIRTN